MRRRCICAAVFTIGLVAATTAACSDDGGGGGQLTLAGYVQTYVSLDQTYEGRAGSLRSDLDHAFEGLSDNDPVPQSIIDTLNELAHEDETFVDEIADLEPPAEVEDLHNETVAALRANNDAVQGVLDDIDTSMTVGELNSRLTSQNLADAGARRREACVAVQEFVNVQGVSVDLMC